MGVVVCLYAPFVFGVHVAACRCPVHGQHGPPLVFWVWAWDDFTED